jgi:hypothetical protein
MRAARRITGLVLAASMGMALACSDSAQPLGTGDKFINDTAGQDAYSASVPVTSDAGSDADAYGPALNTCASCSCDPTRNYCFSGGTPRALSSVPVHILSGGFGEPDGAAQANIPPPPPCPILDAGTMSNGCTPLPQACEATPTCACVLNALQPLYVCYLVCSPSPGFLEVYCPNGS